MKSNEQIDEAFRIRLYNAEVSAPAHVWPAVEEKLRKRKRRILFFWLWFGGLTAIGGSFLLLHSAGPQAEVQPRIATLSAEKESGASLLNQGQSPMLSAADKSNPKQWPARPAQSEHRTQAIRADKRRTTQVQTPRTPQDVTAKAALLPIVSNPAAPIPVPVTSALNAGLPVFGKLDLSLLPAGYVLGIAAAPRLNLPTPAGIPRRSRIIRRNKDHKYCFDFGKHPRAWMLDAYVGPSLAFKELSAADPEYKDYLESRLRSETKLWAFNGGVRANYIFDRFLKLSAGLHYDQMVERLDYVDPNSLQITVKWEYVNGVLTPVDTLSIAYGEAYLIAYNRYGMLELPLQAGVELRKGRSGINVNAGLSFNLLFWKRGAILSPVTGAPSYFTPGDASGEEVFQTRTGMSAIGSFQWFYHLKPRTRLFVESYFRQIIQPINLGTHPVSQRYGVGGLRLGVSRILQ